MKKIKILILLSIIIIMTSCNFFGPVDSATMKHPIEKPQDIDLIGMWEVDSFSYKLIKKHYVLDNKKVKLNLKKNGTFEINNLPDFEIGGFGQPINKKFFNVTGKWNVEKDYFKKYWDLKMNFDKAKPYEFGLTTSYDLYKKKIKA